MMKRIFSAVAAVLLTFAWAVTAFGTEELDLTRKGSLHFTMEYEGYPTIGGNLIVYQVATLTQDDNGNYRHVLTVDCPECQEALDQEDWQKATGLLMAHMSRHPLEGQTKDIDDEGQVAFSDLPLGVYLVVQTVASRTFEPLQPFLVSLPLTEGENYIYDVDGTPKLSLIPADTQWLPTETTKPDIPYTGQTKWPVPVLFVGGLSLICFGLIILTQGKRKDDA